MKKIISIFLSFIFILAQYAPVVAAETASDALLTTRLSGTIINETDNSIEVKSHSSDYTVVLHISPSTYIIDAVTGIPMPLKDRVDDNVAVNYGPAETMSLPPQSNAVLIICNIPQDYMPPHYAKAEAVEMTDNAVKVTTNGGSIIVTINDGVPISPYRTRNLVTINNIRVGTELALWYTAVAMSYPGQAAATKAVILGQDDALITNNDNISGYSSFDAVIEDIDLAASSDNANVGKVTAVDKDGSVYNFNINDNTKLLDLGTMDFIKITDLKTGQEIRTFHNNNTPVLAIEPPQLTPDVLIVKDKNSIRTVKVDLFDENGLSSDHELVINVSDDTIIVNSDVEKLSKYDIINKELVVFYTITTFSLPPQTPPEKIIVLTNDNDNNQPIKLTKNEIIDSLTEEQLFETDGITYVRISDAASSLGFNVAWNGDNRTVSMSKDDLSIVITIGKNDYEYVDSTQRFTNPPFILNDRTFVEIDFLDSLMQ